jgi:hypothetical protein
MRTFSQLIQAALADPGFNEIRERPDLDSDSFKVFQVNLTTVRYRGLQPVWFFAVLGESVRTAATSVQTSARALIREASAPAACVSARVPVRHHVRRLAGIAGSPASAFGIDSPACRAPGPRTQPVRAPFIMAVREVQFTQLSTLLSQPYHPNTRSTAGGSSAAATTRGTRQLDQQLLRRRRADDGKEGGGPSAAADAGHEIPFRAVCVQAGARSRQGA